MAMNLGGSEGDVIVEMNTTPLIDVMLVLLIMLILTIPIQLHSANLNMPVGKPAEAQKPEVVKVDVDERSIVYWQGEPLPDRDALEARMRAAARQAVQPQLHLRPMKHARYEVVAGVLASAQRLGLTKIGVVGSEQFMQ